MDILYAIEDIDVVAEQLLAKLIFKVVLFNGAMGAGKTTLIKSLARKLDITDAVSSPTFSIVNEYLTPVGGKIFHFDAYRLQDENEAYNIGMDEYLYSGEWCFIEWAEKIPNLIPEKHNIIDISIVKDGLRKVVLT
ncbi:MAG: tRNA (adenosine(37)-N6)-threonylcarbamoyltransferase complex ATPase subunit type 1 TsaE [Chitinophagaceae bacterium]|nr:MAG: tRNA (adenosine(37)-N6)-threonylcarbamoyltransferase complex ATPase subunit type 1 TsaE [Chitinophagaceae bacterium]